MYGLSLRTVSLTLTFIGVSIAVPIKVLDGFLKGTKIAMNLPHTSIAHPRASELDVLHNNDKTNRRHPAQHDHPMRATIRTT